jgi:phosphoribosylglycinamide formyltransferase-1
MEQTPPRRRRSFAGRYPDEASEAMRLGVLASHEGTTLQAVLDAVADGRIPAEVAVVISNNRESGALKRAHAAGLFAAHLSSVTHPDHEQLDRAILKTLTDARVDVVLLAGYMKKLGPNVLREYGGRIVNTHPALLPKFGGKGMYGDRVHQAVLASGDSETGVSVHLVDAEYDTGPVLAQCRVPVLPGDSVAKLAARVQAREKEFIIEVLAKMAEGDLQAWKLAKSPLRRT